MTSGLDNRNLTQSYWPLDDSTSLVEHTLGSLLRERAEQHPTTTAIVGAAHGSGEQRRLTYRELHEEVSRVAAALLELADPGDFVALWAPNIIEWPIILFGAALPG